MNLDFNLLVVDDNPDSIEQAVLTLKEDLEEKAFRLKRTTPLDFSEQHLDRLARAEGRDYDLVMIDYNLGRDDTNGSAVAKRLRMELQYTDMIFYSSNPNIDLHRELANQQVAGVFVARRDELDAVLVGIANTVIGKVVDINHMRGLAMAETAEMDVLMERTLSHAFQFSSSELAAIKKRTIEKLQESVAQDQKRLGQLAPGDDFGKVLGISRIFSLSHKYRALKRVANRLHSEPSLAMKTLDSFQSEIIHPRNKLAHVSGHVTEDGKTTLRSTGDDGKDVEIDDAWMTDFRRNLMRHWDALDAVCRAIEKQFGTGTTDDSEQNQP